MVTLQENQAQEKQCDVEHEYSIHQNTAGYMLQNVFLSDAFQFECLLRGIFISYGCQFFVQLKRSYEQLSFRSDLNKLFSML